VWIRPSTDQRSWTRSWSPQCATARRPVQPAGIMPQRQTAQDRKRRPDRRGHHDHDGKDGPGWRSTRSSYELLTMAARRQHLGSDAPPQSRASLVPRNSVPLVTMFTTLPSGARTWSPSTWNLGPLPGAEASVQHRRMRALPRLRGCPRPAATFRGGGATAGRLGRACARPGPLSPRPQRSPNGPGWPMRVGQAVRRRSRTGRRTEPAEASPHQRAPA